MKAYHAILLKGWCEETSKGDPASPWRFLLTEIGSPPQAPRGFADWGQLIGYLAAQFPTPVPPPPDPAQDSQNTTPQAGSTDTGGL